MNKAIIVIYAILLHTAGFAQSYFEGEVIYSNKFTSKIANLTSEQLAVLVGDKQEYFIKDGNYKSFLNGRSITMQLYHSSSNRIYNRTPQSDTLYWFDASVNTEGVISVEVVKNKEVILKVMCDALVLKTKKGITTFYYNSKYKANTELFRNHQYGNWYYMLSKTGALPLKTVVENGQFIMVSTAIAIKPMSLGDNYFVIEPGIPIKRSI